MMRCAEKLEKIADIVSDERAAGNLSIVVLHRGWVFIGVLDCDDDGIYHLTNCENVRKWSSGGFGGLTRGGTTSGAVLDRCESISFDAAAMILCGRLPEGWHSV